MAQMHPPGTMQQEALVIVTNKVASNPVLHALCIDKFQPKALSEERTSGTIEAWNYIIKQVEHSVHRKRPDVFLQKQYRVILGRQLQFVDQLALRERKKCSVCQSIIRVLYFYKVCVFLKETDIEEEKGAEGKMGEASKAFQRPPQSTPWEVPTGSMQKVPFFVWNRPKVVERVVVILLLPHK